MTRWIMYANGGDLAMVTVRSPKPVEDRVMSVVEVSVVVVDDIEFARAYHGLVRPSFSCTDVKERPPSSRVPLRSINGRREVVPTNGCIECGSAVVSASFVTRLGIPSSCSTLCRWTPVNPVCW